MKKTLAIIELTTHTETINSLCLMLAHSTFEVSFYISRSIYDELDTQANSSVFSWYIQEKNIGLSSFLKAQQANITAHDIVFFNTVLFDFKTFWELSQQCQKSIYRIHNAHSHFLTMKHFSMQQVIRTSFHLNTFFFKKKILQRDIWYRKKFQKSISYFTFPSTSIQEHILAKCPQLTPKVIASLPMCCADASMMETQKNDTPFTICIPGSYDALRKDIATFPHVLELLAQQDVKDMVFVFLGKISENAQANVQQIKAISRRNPSIQLVMFEQRVPQSEFEYWMRQSDVLLLPIQQYTYSGYVQEIYGSSKISGGINDMIRYHQRAIIPSWYSVDETLVQQVYTYTDEQEIAQLLLSLSQKKLETSIIEDNRFSSENQCRIFDTILQGVLEKEMP